MMFQFNYLISVNIGNTDRISDVHPFAPGRGCSDLSYTALSKKKGHPADVNPEHGKDLQFST